MIGNRGRVRLDRNGMEKIPSTKKLLRSTVGCELREKVSTRCPLLFSFRFFVVVPFFSLCVLPRSSWMRRSEGMGRSGERGRKGSAGVHGMRREACGMLLIFVSILLLLFFFLFPFFCLFFFSSPLVLPFFLSSFSPLPPARPLSAARPSQAFPSA